MGKYDKTWYTWATGIPWWIVSTNLPSENPQYLEKLNHPKTEKIPYLLLQKWWKTSQEKNDREYTKVWQGIYIWKDTYDYTDTTQGYEMKDRSDMDVYLQGRQKEWKHSDSAIYLSIMLLLSWKP